MLTAVIVGASLGAWSAWSWLRTRQRFGGDVDARLRRLAYAIGMGAGILLSLLWRAIRLSL